MRELATREGVDNSYVSRMINLTLLPPWTVTAILDDTLPNYITLFDLAVDPPVVWRLSLVNVRGIFTTGRTDVPGSGRIGDGCFGQKNSFGDVRSG